MSAVKEKLDVTERTKFRKLESIVAEGISSFVVVGEALKEIRDNKLYRESYKTFEKYVDQKWGMARQRAYQLIDAVDAKANLSTVVDKNERASEVKTERQFRELKDVPAESMEAVIDKAAEIAGDDPITASDLKQARVEILEQAEPEEESEPVYEDVDDEPADSPAQEAIGNGKHLQTLQNLVNELLREMVLVPDVVGLELYHARFNRIKKEVESIKGHLVTVKPVAVCPRCDGAGCSQCGNHGWVSSATLKELGK
jgi:RNase H-fold protein (predicted Holliday junction resolvase)